MLFIAVQLEFLEQGGAVIKPSFHRNLLTSNGNGRCFDLCLAVGMMSLNLLLLLQRNTPFFKHIKAARGVAMRIILTASKSTDASLNVFSCLCLQSKKMHFASLSK